MSKRTSTIEDAADVAATLREKRDEAIEASRATLQAVREHEQAIEDARGHATETRARVQHGEDVPVLDVVTADAAIEVAELRLTGAKARANRSQAIPQHVGIIETIRDALNSARLGIEFTVAETVSAGEEDGLSTRGSVLPGPALRGTTYRPIDPYAEFYDHATARVVLVGGGALSLPERTLCEALEAHPRVHRVTLDARQDGRYYTVNLGRVYPEAVPTLDTHDASRWAGQIVGADLDAAFHSPEHGQQWAEVRHHVRATVPGAGNYGHDLAFSGAVEVIEDNGSEVRLRLQHGFFVAVYEDVAPFSNSREEAHRHVEVAVEKSRGQVLPGLGVIESGAVSWQDGSGTVSYETKYKRAA